MGGPAFDCLRNPLGAIRFLFEKTVSSNEDFTKLNKSDWGATETFHRFVYQDGGLDKIPVINDGLIDSIAPNSLVRFRGMVQDMLDNEYYVGAFKDGEMWRTNKYTDVSSVIMDPSAEIQVWDRRLLYCVPVPGLNSWVRECAVNKEVTSGEFSMGQREKRPRDDSNEMMDAEEMDVGNLQSNETKRKREEDNTSSTAMEISQEQQSTAGQNLDLKLGEDKLLPCLVKIYDLDTDFKLNDIVEFVGILTHDPELSSPLDNINGDSFADGLSQDLLPSKVPRLHCILSKKLSTSQLVFPSEMHEVPSNFPIKELRSTLLQNLAAILGGDTLAAEYFLLHIISQVHARVEPVAVGKLSLNLSGIGRVPHTSMLANTIAEVIKELLPCSCYIPVTIDYLNKASFSPKKNYETNRLVTGALQLASGTHLTVDETQLKAGTLNSVGLKNVSVFKNLLDWQKVEYDFQYYTMDMPSDIQVLILSDGKSNIFPADLLLPLRPSSNPCLLSASQFQKQQWRLYLSMSKSLSGHTIDSAMQQVLEDDMVTARQEDRSIGTEVFSRWLTMARLVSLSFGEKDLTIEHWQLVKDLEKQRLQRVSSAN